MYVMTCAKSDEKFISTRLKDKEEKFANIPNVGLGTFTNMIPFIQKKEVEPELDDQNNLD